jgi:Toxin co-regulated pilus biosynthesis protein Q
MKISKSKFSTISALSFFGLAILLSGTGYAGFSENNSVRVSEPVSPSVSPSKSIKSEKQKALQIFNDRYVPESTQKKYKLDDKWFEGKSPSEGVIVYSPKDILEVKPNTIAEPVVINDTWRARKGETIRDVLQRWSERSQIHLMWASPESPILKDGFSFIGKYQDAVNLLIKKEGGETIHSQYRSEGLDPVMMVPASTITTNTAPLTEETAPEEEKAQQGVSSLTKIFKPAESQEKRPETRWFGLSGASLAEVIKVWSEDAGVTLIWQAEKNFALQESISQVGHFEDAIFRALSQYDNEPIRPVGQLYQDSKTGKSVLIVKTEVN